VVTNGDPSHRLSGGRVRKVGSHKANKACTLAFLLSALVP